MSEVIHIMGGGWFADKERTFEIRHFIDQLQRPFVVVEHIGPKMQRAGRLECSLDVAESLCVKDPSFFMT